MSGISNSHSNRHGQVLKPASESGFWRCQFLRGACFVAGGDELNVARYESKECYIHPGNHQHENVIRRVDFDIDKKMILSYVKEVQNPCH